MTLKIIIDADPGIEDALALAVGLFDPEIEILAITATAGCVSGAQATRNVETLIGTLDPPRWPRLGSSADAVAMIDPDLLGSGVSPSRLNGPHGLGDWPVLENGLHHQHSAEKLMADIVRNNPNEVTLLTLGPLSNVARAMERDAEFLQLLRGMVCLGGSVKAGGDVTAAAEFNIFADPEAARLVLGSPATKTLIPLDVTRQVTLTFEHLARLETERSQAPLARFLQATLPFSLRSHHQLLGEEGMKLPALTALAWLAQNQLGHTESMKIDIETSGQLTRGMTVFDRRSRVGPWRANIDVLQSIESRGVIDYLSRIVKNILS